MQDEDHIITPGELQAELNSLRNLRRRSLSQPSDGTLDPDLISTPALPSTSAATTGPISNLSYPLIPTAEVLDGLPDDVAASSDSDTALPLSDLFWLPAHLHPEIAPQKFKQFLREQTKPENLQRRTSGKSAAGGLDRRKSTLSRQIDPNAALTSEEESSTLESKTSLKKKQGGLEGLTISDLQRLELLAAQAAQETGQDEQGQLRLTNALRRSLSLDQSRSPEDQEAEEEADSPLIVPAPGSILRRSARTKIRKPSLLGDGGGHRFAASRRTKLAVSPPVDDQVAPITPEKEIGDPIPEVASPTSPSVSPTKKRLSAGYHRPTSASYTEATPEIIAIGSTSAVRPTPRHQRSISGDSFLDPQPSTSEFGAITTEAAAEQQFETYPGRRHASPPREVTPVPSASTSARPSAGRRHSDDHARAASTPTVVEPTQSKPTTAPVPSVSPSAKEKEKEKKSTWARFGLTRTGSSASLTPSPEDAITSAVVEDEHVDRKRKKGKKSMGEAIDEIRHSHTSSTPSVPKEAKEKEKEKEPSGFFGLFKKRPTHGEQDGSGTTTPPTQALSPTASGMIGKNGKYTNFYRLPIHVERAVYRLSHIKLANPRRPLYEQVLISNLMFWYLSVINKPQHPAPQQKASIPPPKPIPVPELHGADQSNDTDSGYAASAYTASTDLHDVDMVDDPTDDQPLKKRVSEPEPALPNAKLVQAKPDRSASLAASTSPLINVKRTTPRTDGFEVHRPQKEAVASSSSSRRVVSESAAPPATRARSKETESAWMSSAESSRSTPAIAIDSLPSPVAIPPASTQSIEVPSSRSRPRSDPSTSPPQSISPPSSIKMPKKSPSRQTLGFRRSSGKLEDGQAKAAVKS